MAIDVDVRSQTDFSVTGVFFADDKKLIGAADSDTISIENDKGKSIVLCQKSEIDNLIKALRAAQKMWGVL